MIRKEFSTILEIKKEIKQRKCCCFGAGRQLTEICDDIPGLVNCIEGIIDNNQDLHYSDKIVRDRKLKIYPAKYLEGLDIDNTLLLITSSYKDEIIEELEKKEVLKNLKYTDFQNMLDAAAWDCKKPPVEFRKNNDIQIPKVLHYCWFGGGIIPSRLQTYIDGWKKLLPEYEIVEWNEKNYDYTKNEYMFSAYKNKKWGFVSDYARIDIVYNKGGIYLDTDVELIRKPDDLLYNDAYIGFERLSTVNTGAGFAAKKKFHILKDILDFYKEREFVNEKDPNKMILCPVYETEILKKHGLKTDGNFQIVDGMTVYPVEYFNAKSLYSNKLKITDRTISIHHCTWTWAGEKNKL